MQLILDAENATDTYTTMATLDESVKNRANGISEEVKELNSNKENVENINPKDKLSGELASTTDVTSEEKLDVIAKDLDKIITDDSEQNENKILGTNEIEESVFQNVSNANDEKAELCCNKSDLSREDLKHVEKQTLVVEQNIENDNPSNVVENGCIDSYLEKENYVSEVMEVDILEVEKTEQLKNINNANCENVDVDKNDSIKEDADKNEIENVLSNTCMEVSVTKTCSQEMNQNKAEEDTHDIVMADMSHKVVDEETHTTEINDDEVVRKTGDDKIPVTNTKENVIRTEESAEILDTIVSSEELTTEKQEIVGSEVIPISINKDNIKNTELSSASATQDKLENDNFQKETIFSVSDSTECGPVNESESMKTILNEERERNDAKTFETINDSMEIVANNESTADKENNSNIEQQNSEKVNQKEDKDIITEINDEPKNNVDSIDCTKILDDLEPGLKDENIKTVSDDNKVQEIKENKSPSASEPLLPKLLNQNSNVITDETKLSNESMATKKLPIRTSRLSNTMDILSDDEDEGKNNDPVPIPQKTNEKQCINIDEDDDVQLVDDIETEITAVKLIESIPVNVNHEKSEEKEIVEEHNIIKNDKTEFSHVADLPASENIDALKVNEKVEEDVREEKPLVPENFLSTCKKSVAEMTREELEEFCVVRIVESVLDKTSLNDIKIKLKTMTQNIEEYKKKAMLLSKQNRDLQVVLKSVQEELKKNTNTPIAPLKITRSVGMQVLMVDKGVRKKLAVPQNQQTSNLNTTIKTRNGNNNNNNNIKPQNAVPCQQIPVPRLVPAQNIQKTNVQNNQKPMPASSGPNNVKKSPAIPKVAEKRPHSRTSSQAVTVDLTDDEPPTKTNRNAVPPIRLINQQSLMASRPSTPQGSSPRKVFIPISPQAQAVRPGQAIMLRPPAPVVNNTAVRGPNTMRMRMPNSVRVMRMNNYRHPAPLPDHVKQYQPPNWKALPPAPDLKLSKVENGIVISWKIDGYQEDLFEEIASYQLYAYQETSVAPSTSLWKKIGDVKALPLPMACTLTQFMTGYKYYFAVRAVDIRSRVGPFSLPGSILLLNKV